MASAHANSWEVADEFWLRVEPLVPQPARDPGKRYKRAVGAGRSATRFGTARSSSARLGLKVLGVCTTVACTPGNPPGSTAEPAPAWHKTSRRLTGWLIMKTVFVRKPCKSWGSLTAGCGK